MRGGGGMRQAILTVASLCLMAALSEQMLDGSRYFGVVRLALGLEIVRALISLMDGFWQAVN